MDLADNFDKMGIVVDWLDCCRNRDLDALLDLYADDAALECACEDTRIKGRAALADYWRPKLSGVSSDAFGLEEIRPDGDGVVLDYLSFEGSPVRIVFAFDAQGKISFMRCAPGSLSSASHDSA
jgi:SnoaL-like domain